MVTIAFIKAFLRDTLAASFHPQSLKCANILYMARQSRGSSVILQQYLTVLPLICPFLKKLTGQQRTMGDMVLSFDQKVLTEHPVHPDRMSGKQFRWYSGRQSHQAVNDPSDVLLNGSMVNAALISLNEGSMNHTEVTVHVQHGSLLHPAASPTIVRTSPPHPHLPAGPFYTHTHILDQIAHELQTGHGVWLTGQRGCGHTTLLRQIMHHPPAGRSFSDGILYVDGMQAPHNLEDLTQSLYNVFYMRTDGTVVHRHPDVVRAELSSLNALFVLDRVRLSSHQLVSLADTLRHSGAMLVAADGLAPDTLLDLPLGSLPHEEALCLFAAETGCDLAQPDHHNIAIRICVAFQYLPLPLVLVARLVRVQATSLAQLVSASEALASEQEPLNRAVRLVLPFLDECERHVLASLVRAGGYDMSLEALTDICEQPPVVVAKALTRMIDLHLVTGSSERYMITTSSLRRILARLLPRGQEQQRTAAFFAAAATIQNGNMTWLGREWLNLMAAARIALLEGQTLQAGQLVRAVQPYVVLRGYWNDWEHLIDLAEQAAQSSGDHALLAWALHERGTRAGLLGNIAAAASLLSRARRMRLDLDDQAGAAATLHNMEYLEVLPTLSDTMADAGSASTAWTLLKLRLLLLLVIFLAVSGISMGLVVLLTDT